MATLSMTQVAGSALSGRLSLLKAHFDAGRARRRAYRKALDELRSLSDREVADLGLSRASFHSIALEAANRV